MPPPHFLCTFRNCKHISLRITGHCLYCEGSHCDTHLMLQDHNCPALAVEETESQEQEKGALEGETENVDYCDNQLMLQERKYAALEGEEMESQERDEGEATDVGRCDGHLLLVDQKYAALEAEETESWESDEWSEEGGARRVERRASC